MYDLAVWFTLTDTKINRYSGKFTEDTYELDRSSFLYFGGATVKDGVVDGSNKLEFNSAEGLKHRVKYIGYALEGTKKDKTQSSGFIHSSKLSHVLDQDGHYLCIIYSCYSSLARGNTCYMNQWTMDYFLFL